MHFRMKKMNLDLCLEKKKIEMSATLHCLRTELEETAWSQCPLLTTRRQLVINLEFGRGHKISMPQTANHL